jgi:hypothetical protein
LLSLFSFASNLTAIVFILDYYLMVNVFILDCNLTLNVFILDCNLMVNVFILDYYLTAIVFILDYYLTPIRYSALYGSHTTLSFFLRPAVGFKLVINWQSIEYSILTNGAPRNE